MINSLRGKREKGVLDQVKIPKTHAMFRGKGQTNARLVVLKPFTGNCYRANSCTALCSAYNHSSNLAQLGSDSCRLIAMYFCIVCVKKGQPLRLKTKKEKKIKMVPPVNDQFSRNEFEHLMIKLTCPALITSGIWTLPPLL